LERLWSGDSYSHFHFYKWGNYVEFRTRTSDRLDGLERDVHSLQRSQVNVSLKSAIDEAKAGQRDNANSHIQQATDILQNLSEDHAPAPNSFFESAINTLNQLRSTTIGEAAVHQASVRLADSPFEETAHSRTDGLEFGCRTLRL
jgi:hypothetical protein